MHRKAWGKRTRSDNAAELSLLAHSLDVAAVVQALLALAIVRARLARLAGLPELSSVTVARLCVFAFLHDVGKCSVGFQSKGLEDLARARVLRAAGGAWHECGHIQVTAPFFSTDRRDSRAAELKGALGCDAFESWGTSSPWRLWLAAISHHGKPVTPDDLRFDLRWTWRASPDFDYDPLPSVHELGTSMREVWPQAFIEGEALPDAEPFIHAFAGLVSLADWIASNPDRAFFPYNLGEGIGRWKVSCARAREVLRAMRIDLTEARERLHANPPSFEQVFGFSPTPLQAAMENDGLGRIAIAESETGSGKTEAALWLFENLFERGEVDSLAFFLPTRVAATQIQERISRFVHATFPEPSHRPNVVLAVPGYVRADEEEPIEMLPAFQVLWPDTDAPDAAARRWAAEGAKRYFAASCAVGTIDQLLLSGMRVSHSHLRATALLRSLLVVDEVHASDTYMTRLLRGVLQRHASAGGHALLLSATLGGRSRRQLLHSSTRRNAPPLSREMLIDTPYPALSDEREIRAIPPTGRTKTVQVDLVPIANDAVAVAAVAAAAAQAGARVLVIRNTVRLAQATQTALERALPDDHASLFRVQGLIAMHHGRYAAADRKLLDERVQAAFGKNAANGPRVLVGTQTLEISLDCDADLLVTDLAPVDVLLQRIGRLHRHERSRPEGFVQPRVVIAVPENRDLSAHLRGGRLGFGPRSPYENLIAVEATWRELEARRSLSIPGDNRVLVEGSTDPETLRDLADALGDGWREYWADLTGRAAAQGGAAHVVSLPWSTPWEQSGFGELTEAVRTRLGLANRRVRLSHPMRSPFGELLEELQIPAVLWPAACEAEQADASEATPGVLRLCIERHEFLYDRLGLRRTTD